MAAKSEVALGQGRALLDQLPHPENLDNHFVVDAAKWDFYSMDCYRILGSQDTASTEKARRKLRPRRRPRASTLRHLPSSGA